MVFIDLEKAYDEYHKKFFCGQLLFILYSIYLTLIFIFSIMMTLS